MKILNCVGIQLLVLSVWGLSSSALSLSDVQKNLGRYEGQTEFFTPFRYNPLLERSAGPATPMAAAAASAPGGSSARAIQEADVFKIGKPGSKLLFLLNNYRGLQIISFENGAEDPVRLGRVPATGNFPSDMYYNEVQNQIVVLERVYFDRSGNYYSENQSRLVIYDVKDPKNPSLLKTVDLKGTIAESRKVGDILYVASRIDPDWRSRGERSKSVGLVTSYSLKAAEPRLIEQFEFTAAVNSAENMGIIEVPIGKDLFRYYLTAVTSDREYSIDGLRPKRYVELVDITDPKGNIVPVMRVSPRGEIQKRSQMLIKNDTLIVVSNYTRDGSWASRDNPARIAVETFQLPTKDSKVIDPSTATYRKEWLKYETGKLGALNEKQREQKISELKSHPENGLQGVFVELNNATGLREKVEPDFTITTGDTNGQSAALQDVRVDGNFLYAFWVPANQIDPLEIYDISRPQNGIKHIAHQEIDGFVQRSAPFTFKGKKYILGMGQITPQDNNEDQSRSFQAVLFPIKDNGRVDRNSIKQITLREPAGYSNLNTSDKFLEIRFSGDGVGQILFSQNTQINGTWTSGGKIVNFDLNKMSADEDDHSVFSEGPFLEGNGSYLKRVFTNTEINRINSFSDKSLATYQEMDSSKQDAFVKAAHVLELARNIRAYFTLGATGQRQGVQVVSSSYSWLASGESKTEFRLVPVDQPDQEEYKGMSRLILDGTYSSHSLLPHEQVLLVTTDRVYNSVSSKSVETQRMYLLGLENGALKVLGAPKVSVTEGYRDSLFRFETPLMSRQNYNRYNSGSSLVDLGDGTFLSSSESQMNRISVAGNQLQFESYDIQGCSVESADQRIESAAVIILDKKPYWTYSEVFELQSESVAVKKVYLADLTLQGGKAVCGAKINIPGSALSLRGQQLVTQDRWAVDTISFERPDYRDAQKSFTVYELVQEAGLTSLAFTGTQAELKDILKATSVSEYEYQLKPLKDGSFLTVQSPASTNNRYYADDRDYPGVYKFQFLHLDNFKFRQTVRALRLSTSQTVTVEKIMENPANPGEYFAVLGSGGQIRVVNWSLATLRPTIVKLAYAGEVAENFVVNGFGWWSRGALETNLSLETRTLEFALGLAGVKQLQLK